MVGSMISTQWLGLSSPLLWSIVCTVINGEAKWGADGMRKQIGHVHRASHIALTEAGRQFAKDLGRI